MTYAHRNPRYGSFLQREILRNSAQNGLYGYHWKIARIPPFMTHIRALDDALSPLQIMAFRVQNRRGVTDECHFFHETYTSL